MVPVNPFEHTVTRRQYRRLIESSVASNYNLIRVWSSRNYYSDELYEAADERECRILAGQIRANFNTSGHSDVERIPI